MAHAQHCVVSCDSLARKPLNPSFAQAATVDVPFTTTALMVSYAMLLIMYTVLVLGLWGAVSSAAPQLARNQVGKALGAARRNTADVNLVSDPQLTTVKSLTGDEGPHMVIDTVGSYFLIKTVVVCLAPRARVPTPKKGSTEVGLKIKSVYCEEISTLDCTLVLTDMAETAKDLERIQEQFENESLKSSGEAQERLSRR